MLMPEDSIDEPESLRASLDGDTALLSIVLEFLHPLAADLPHRKTLLALRASSEARHRIERVFYLN